MNRNGVIIIVVIIIMAGGGIFLLSSSDRSATPDQNGSKNSASISTQSDAPTGESAQSLTDDRDEKAGSRYVEYSKTAFDQAANTRRVMYFYATWCPSCKAANADFLSNSEMIPEDVIVIRTNYNDSDTDQNEKDLARKYGITYQHTFVQIDGQGNEVTTWNGGEVEELLTNLK